MAASFEETLSQHGLLAMLDLVMREHASVLRAVLDADGVLGLHQCIEHSVATIDQLSPPARAAAAVGAHVGVLIGLQVGLLLRHVETPQVH
jgi:hypothetical protein